MGQDKLKGLKLGAMELVNNMTTDNNDLLNLPSPLQLKIHSRNSTMGIPTKGNYGNYFEDTSRYDSGITKLSRVEEEGVNQLRSEIQPWYDKIGAGAIKGTSLAATTFADTFAGTIAGLIKGVSETGDSNNWKGILDNPITNGWDNPITLGFNKWNNNLEKWLPNYYSNEENKNNQEGNWYKNIFTANFIGDVLLKNTGFMVGAALSGKVVAGAAEGLMKLGEARKLYEGYSVIANDGKKAENLIEKLKMVATGDATIDGKAIALDALYAAKKLRTGGQLLKIIGATAGALGEARLEAVNNSTQFAERLQGLLQEALPSIVKEEHDKLEKENPSYFDLDGSLTKEGKEELDNRVNEKYTVGLAKIEELRTKYGNRDFLANLPLLTLSDYVLFGRSYAGGFKNAARDINMVDKVVDGIKSVEAVKPSLLKKAWIIAKTPLTEGPYEEMGLSTISNTLQQYYGAELNSFMGHLIDPNANKESIDWLNAIGQGAKQEYGTMAGWEDGFIGGLMGAIGIPMRGGEVRIDKNGKATHPIIMNGVIGEVRELNENYKEDQLLAEELNKRFQDPKFLEYYKANNRRLSFGADKLSALETKDEFEFKNAEHSELISDAILFDKVGRIQDLYDHIDGMNNLSDEDIAGIRLDLTKKGNEELPYQNKTDEELREYFKNQAIQTKESIDNYRKIADDLAVKSGDTFKGDDLSELVWMLSKVDNWELRFHQVHKDLSENIRPIVKQLNKGVYTDIYGEEQPINEVLNQSPGDLLAALLDDASNLRGKIDKTLTKRDLKALDAHGAVINQEIQLDLKTDNRGLSQAMGKLARLKEEVKKNENILKNSDDIIGQINDLERLSAARVSFLLRYNGYIQNPERLKLDLKKVIAESKKELVKVDNTEIKDKKNVVDKFTTYDEYKDYLNTTFTNKDDAADFNNQMVVSGNQFAKLHKDLSLNALTVKDLINKTRESPAVKEGAQLIFDRLLKKTNSKEELFDENQITKNLFDDVVLKSGAMITPEESLAVEKLVKLSIANAKINAISTDNLLEIPIGKVDKTETPMEQTSEIDEINRARRKELEVTFGKNVELASSSSTYAIDWTNIYSAKYPDGMGLQNGENVSAEYKEIMAKYDAQIVALIEPVPGKDLTPVAPLTNEGGIISVPKVNTVKVIKYTNTTTPSIELTDIDSEWRGSFEDIDITKIVVLEIRGRNNQGKITGTIRITGKTEDGPIIQKYEVLFEDTVLDKLKISITPTPQLEAKIKGQNHQVYWNEIPEFDVNEKKKGNFIPHKDIFPHDASKYDHFTNLGTWDYLNKPNEKGEFNIKEGDTIGFMIDPEFRKKKSSHADTIFITHGPNNQIIGSLHGYKKSGDFTGLTELRDRIEKEYAETGKITETTKIGKVNGGYVELKRGKDTDLNDTTKNVDKKNLVFSIASTGLAFYFDHSTVPVNKITPPNKPGMVYMHEKMADGNYASVPLTVKTFNKKEFDRADVTTLANPMFQLIDKAVNTLAKAQQPEDVKDGYDELSEALFLGESKMAKDKKTAISSNKLAIHIGLSKDKSTLIIRKEELGVDGIYRETGVDKIWLTEQDKNPNKVYPPKNLARNDVESIKDLIYESLYKNDILFNVDASKINTPGYNEELYDSNVLKTSMVKSGVLTVWFYILAKTPSGTPIDFVAPSLLTNGIVLQVKSLPKTNPVVESESVIKGTKVTKGGTDYFVDNGVVTDSNGEVITSKIVTKPILDLAYIRDGVNGKFGTDFELNHKVSKDEWKVLDGSILNVNTLVYKLNVPTEKSNESETKSTPSSSPLGIKLKRDPNLMGSYGEKSTDFKNSQTNVLKNLELSKKIPNFASLESNLKGPLVKKGFTNESFDALTQEEKEHELNCIK